jgi:hypothetical protein
VLGLAPMLALAAAGGFVSLSFEVFFFRTISYATASSSTAFAVTLSAFLIGLASGSRRAGEDCASLTTDATMRQAAATLMKATFLGLLFLPLLGHLAWLDRGVVGVAILLVYLFARYWGALLPYLAELGVAADDQQACARPSSISPIFSARRRLHPHRICVDEPSGSRCAGIALVRRASPAHCC